MMTRDELKTLIDQMPEEELDLVRVNLERIMHPPASNPLVEKMMRRSEELRSQLPERLKQLQAGNPPESIRGFYGGGSLGSGPHPSRGYGEHAFSWQEGRAHVRHRLLLHEDHEMDFVERLQLTEDEKMLVYEQEIYAEGRFVKRREEFPAMVQKRD
jgi:hypothetical protein